MMRMMVDEDDASHKGKSLGDKCSLTVPLKYQFHGQTVLHDHQLQGWVDENPCKYRQDKMHSLAMGIF